MKIPYKKQRSTSAFISAILWGTYGLYGIYTGVNSTFGYIAPIVCICYFIYYLFDKETCYFTVEYGNIKTRKIFGKRISLSEIERVDEEESKVLLKQRAIF